MAVLAPIPKPSVSTARIANPGAWSNCRQAKRRSWTIVFIRVAPSVGLCVACLNQFYTDRNTWTRVRQYMARCSSDPALTPLQALLLSCPVHNKTIACSQRQGSSRLLRLHNSSPPDRWLGGLKTWLMPVRLIRHFVWNQMSFIGIQTEFPVRLRESKYLPLTNFVDNIRNSQEMGAMRNHDTSEREAAENVGDLKL